MKKVYESYLGTFWIYNLIHDQERMREILERLFSIANTYIVDWHAAIRKKRKGYFNKIVCSNSQIIHREPQAHMNGSIAVKFKVSGPKWQIRKLLKWKRPKKKKWQNNKRVYA